MKITNKGFSIHELYERYKKGILSFEFCVQRQSSMWNTHNKSLLIHTALADMIIPDLYLREIDKSGVTVYEVIDGIQRLSTFFEYFDNDCKLSPDTPDVVIGEDTFHIAKKKFKDLPDKLKEKLQMTNLQTKLMWCYTDEEIEEQFFRLNNGVGFSKQQIANIKLGGKLATEMKELAKDDFWDRTAISPASKKKGVPLEVILRTLMLMSNYKYGEKMAVSQVCKFADYISDIYNGNEFEENKSDIKSKENLTLLIKECKELIEKTNKCLLDDQGDGYVNKFLTANNIPIVLMFTRDYMQYNERKINKDTGEVMDEDFYTKFMGEFIEDFYINSAKINEYANYCGRDINSKDNIQGRLDAVCNGFYEFCEGKKYVAELMRKHENDPEYCTKEECENREEEEKINIKQDYPKTNFQQCIIMSPRKL